MSSPKLPEEVLNWLYFADEDYLSAEIMLKARIYNKVCFLSQQAIEKGLKAYLLNCGKRLKKTHKIIDLLAECVEIEPVFKSFENEALEIDRYYIPTRYPDAVVGALPEGLPGKEQAGTALESASRIIKFLKNRLGV